MYEGSARTQNLLLAQAIPIDLDLDDVVDEPDEPEAATVVPPDPAVDAAAEVLDMDSSDSDDDIPLPTPAAAPVPKDAAPALATDAAVTDAAAKEGAAKEGAAKEGKGKLKGKPRRVDSEVRGAKLEQSRLRKVCTRRIRDMMRLLAKFQNPNVRLSPIRV